MTGISSSIDYSPKVPDAVPADRRDHHLVLVPYSISRLLDRNHIHPSLNTIPYAALRSHVMFPTLQIKLPVHEQHLVRV